jgi:transcriptional regulator with XRE-family HTH domain
MPSLGEAVRFLRSERRWTQDYLAKSASTKGRMEVSRSLVANLEAGQIENISARAFVALALAFNITADDLACQADYIASSVYQTRSKNTIILPDTMSEDNKSLVRQLIVAAAKDNSAADEVVKTEEDTDEAEELRKVTSRSRENVRESQRQRGAEPKERPQPVKS